jgi:hypothetical protein
MKADSVRIGCGAGFWGDTESAAPQLLAAGELHYLVFDYLAEITMSIMAAARLRNEKAGYATDFVTRVMRPCMRDALSRKVRIVTNAGGVNPLACRDALLSLAAELGVAPKIAVVLGDDLLPRKDEWLRAVTALDADRPLPSALLSANAYLGAQPIVAALRAGADIVITGRVVDSALVLGPLVHEFGWRWDDFDRLAQGSLAGHIIECGAQATGGLFTDWEDVSGYADMGYPIVECASDGSFVLTKPAATGGLVTPAVVYEQLVYEIGDPRAYVLPDVVCDFSEVQAEQVGQDRVRVWGARGRCPTPSYKVSATYPDGYKVDVGVVLSGDDAARKGRRVAEALFAKLGRLLSGRGLAPFSATRIDTLGAESSYGPHARALATREVVVRLAASHADRDALKLLLREVPQAGTSMAPGLSAAIGGRAEPQTVIRHCAFLLDKAYLHVELDIDGARQPLAAESVPSAALSNENRQVIAYPALAAETRLPLIALAHGRSGDKGDVSNIGILAREARFVSIIGAALTADAVSQHLAHLLDPQRAVVRRYELPGCHGWNFVLEHALGGGGVASLRADPQGKAHAQQLLAFELPVPEPIYSELRQRGSRRDAPAKEPTP